MPVLNLLILIPRLTAIKQNRFTQFVRSVRHLSACFLMFNDGAIHKKQSMRYVLNFKNLFKSVIAHATEINGHLGDFTFFFETTTVGYSLTLGT